MFIAIQIEKEFISSLPHIFIGFEYYIDFESCTIFLVT